VCVNGLFVADNDNALDARLGVPAVHVVDKHL
jgi:hypothetical protein